MNFLHKRGHLSALLLWEDHDDGNSYQGKRLFGASLQLNSKVYFLFIMVRSMVARRQMWCWRSWEFYIVITKTAERDCHSGFNLSLRDLKACSLSDILPPVRPYLLNSATPCKPSIQTRVSGGLSFSNHRIPVPGPIGFCPYHYVEKHSTQLSKSP